MQKLETEAFSTIVETWFILSFLAPLPHILRMCSFNQLLPVLEQSKE